MTLAEPPRIPGFTPERRDRIPLAGRPVFRATAMVVAPVSAYRPLPMLEAPARTAPEASINATPATSPDEVDLDQLMVRLKAVAAMAQQAPASRTDHRHFVFIAAIVLSIISGAVTAQYLIPGHSRPHAGLLR